MSGKGLLYKFVASCVGILDSMNIGLNLNSISELY